MLQTLHTYLCKDLFYVKVASGTVDFQLPAVLVVHTKEETLQIIPLSIWISIHKVLQGPCVQVPTRKPLSMKV